MLLIEATANINNGDRMNVTPLYTASQNGHHDTDLLGAGTYANRLKSDCTSPLSITSITVITQL